MLDNELESLITIGRAAVELGVLHDQLRRLCDRKEIPFRRFLGRRLVHRDDLATIREVCVRRGYLKPAAEALANA
jgi:excisionase family DNA binding protein